MRIVTYIEPLSTQVNGKFVQFSWLGQEHLVFGSFTQFTYHIEILMRFLDESKIQYKKLNHEHLVIKDSVFNMVGGGHFTLNSTQKILELSGSSQAFGKFENFELVTRIAQSFPAWQDFHIRIRT